MAGTEDRLVVDKLMVVSKGISQPLGEIKYMALRFQTSALNFKPKGLTSSNTLFAFLSTMNLVSQKTEMK